MSDAFFRELVSQFAQITPSWGNEFSGVIGAIRTRSELEKKEEKCWISDRSSLKCSILNEEVTRAIELEKQILILMDEVINERSKNGANIPFPAHDDQFANFTTSEFYQSIKKLYILRYGENEGRLLDTAFIGSHKEKGVRIMIEYRRHQKSPPLDMSPSSFYIKRLHIQRPSRPEEIIQVGGNIV